MWKTIIKLANVSLAIVAMLVLSRSAKADDCTDQCQTSYDDFSTGCQDGCYGAYQANNNFNLQSCISGCVNDAYSAYQSCLQGCEGS